MIDYDAPYYFLIKAVVAVNYKITGIHYAARRRNWNSGIEFENPVHRFSDYANVALDELSIYPVFD